MGSEGGTASHHEKNSPTLTLGLEQIWRHCEDTYKGFNNGKRISKLKNGFLNN